eukprot:6191137-Pleurochrysis_carterae.AAC.3
MRHMERARAFLPPLPFFLPPNSKSSSFPIVCNAAAGCSRSVTLFRGGSTLIHARYSGATTTRPRAALKPYDKSVICILIIIIELRHSHEFQM